MKKINDSERNIYLFFVITLLWTWGFGFSSYFLPIPKIREEIIFIDASILNKWELNAYLLYCCFFLSLQ